MIGKEKLPYAHRMRIIQKLEGDFNAPMKYTIGRTFMHHMYDNNLNSDATYGGLKNKNCHQMLLRCQVTTEYCQHYWNHIKKNTSSSTSGLHFGHYKAMAHSDFLS